MENVSEIRPHTKRGRPVKFSPERLAITSFSAPDVKTIRGKQNNLLLLRAMNVIGDDFPWLCDKGKIDRCETNALRVTILAELGRIDDDDVLRRIAGQICDRKPTAREAVILIRRFRTRKNSAGDVTTLAKRIARTVDDFTLMYPDTPGEDLLAAMDIARTAVEETYSDGCTDDD
jgi:hypothetical protein